jgi:hypothetical protein
MMSYYCNCVKSDEEWTYSVQACKEEFLAKYLHQNVLEKFLTAHIHRIFNRFVTTDSVEKGKSSGRPKVMENIVENIRDHLEAHPRTYLLDCLIKLQYIHAIKFVRGEHAFTSIQLYNNCSLMILKAA